MMTKTVRLNNDDIVFLSGVFYHAERHYKEMIELNYNSLSENAKRDLERLEQIKKKLGIVQKS